MAPPPTTTTRRGNSKRAKTTQTTANFGSFLTNTPPNEEDLLAIPDHSLEQINTQLGKVADFLNHHSLALTATSSNSTILSATPYYLPTVADFCESQMSRQAAGLRTNTNRASAADVAPLLESHSKALIAAMDEPNTLDLLHPTKLCEIHGILRPSSGGGQYRTNQVRAGKTVFGPALNVEEETNKLMVCLRSYYTRWFKSGRYKHTHREVDNRFVHRAVTFAAMAVFGLSNIHPFSDGNGRMGRLYANALLHSILKLPFSITLTATPAQRQVYVLGLRLADAAIRLNSSTDSSFLGPLVGTILERVVTSVSQLESLLEERARASSNEQEHAIARRVRERAAASQCLICLDDGPNIATLCCGQAVHLNCLAEWLANSGSGDTATCVACRSPLPRLQRQLPPQDIVAERPPENRPSTDFHPRTMAWFRSIAERDRGDEQEAASQDSATATTAVDELPQCLLCRNRAAINCDNSMCGRCCLTQGLLACMRHGRYAADAESATTEDDDDDTEEVEDGDTDDVEEDHTEEVEDDDTEDKEEDDTLEVQEDSAQELQEDDTEEVDDDSTEQVEDEDTENSTSSSVTVETDDDTTAALGVQMAIKCAYCKRNKPAMDCANEMCGRCCLVSGLSYGCARHSF